MLHIITCDPPLEVRNRNERHASMVRTGNTCDGSRTLQIYAGGTLITGMTLTLDQCYQWARDLTSISNEA